MHALDAFEGFERMCCALCVCVCVCDGEHALSCLAIQLTRILTLGNRAVPRLSCNCVCVCVCAGTVPVVLQKGA